MTSEGQSVGAAPAPPPPPHAPVPANLVADLGASGAHFVAELWREYDGWTPAAIVLLRQVGLAVDRLEGCRQRIATEGVELENSRGTKYPHPLLRVEHQNRGALLNLLAALKLREG